MAADATGVGLLSLQVAQRSDLGGRASNQDHYGSAEQDELACFVVADGVGGYQGGEIASRLVVDAVLQRFCQEALFGERALRSYVNFAIAEVGRRKQQAPQLAEMSATVAAVLVDRQAGVALFAHLGDTRIYLFRQGRLSSVTRDHSAVQQFIDAGYCEPAQLRTHPLRSTLLAAVGIESETSVDMIDPPLPLEAGDALLICSDGFWEWIGDDAMAGALREAGSVQAWLDSMAATTQAASTVSGKVRDNSTVIAVWVGPPQDTAIQDDIRQDRT